MDRRLCAANGRVADAALRGQVTAAQFTSGEAASIAAPLVDLCAAPNGARDRQLRLGAQVQVFERHAGWAFLRHEADGYVGYIPETALAAPTAPTHRITARASHLYEAPKAQAQNTADLPMDARLRVREIRDGWAETEQGFVPAPHLHPLDQPCADPVAVAERLFGAPYLWGGNSAAGIDCSGLVQMAMSLCHIPCPGDADLQERSLGAPLPENAPLQRGDLLFWRGHVALAQSPTSLIHANGHSMSVATEPLDAALARIAQHEYGALTSRRRLTPPSE